MTPTSISMTRPMRKETRTTANRKSSRRYFRRNTAGYMSTMAVTRLSTHTNWCRRGEKVINRNAIIIKAIMKKKNHQNGGACYLKIVHSFVPDCPALEKQSWWRRGPPTRETRASWTQHEGKLWMPGQGLCRDKSKQLKLNKHKPA